MYFNEEEILHELSCPRCNQTFVDPRITPCFKTICSNCIEDLTSENEIKCFFCKEMHKIPDRTGFQSNEYVSKILAKRPKQIYRGEIFRQLESKLEDLTNILNKLETGIKNPNTIINDYCSDLKNKIDLVTEQKINELNLMRVKYIEKIDDFERMPRKKCSQ